MSVSRFATDNLVDPTLYLRNANDWSGLSQTAAETFHSQNILGDQLAHRLKGVGITAESDVFTAKEDARGKVAKGEADAFGIKTGADTEAKQITDAGKSAQSSSIWGGVGSLAVGGLKYGKSKKWFGGGGGDDDILEGTGGITIGESFNMA